MGAMCPPATTWLPTRMTRAAEARGRKEKGQDKNTNTLSYEEKKRAENPIPLETTTEGDTALPPSFLTRNDSSSFSVKLADWARSHRSITRGSSNSARKQGLTVWVGSVAGHTLVLGAHVACQPKGIVCAASREH